jgi:CubicO group peptidase (beta-lactamase class C family)
MGYDELVRTRILAPLGMSDTGVHADGGRLATGHTRRGNATPHWHLAALAGGWPALDGATLLAFLRLHADPPQTARV